MSLNKSKGNMYGFVSHTWNPVSGWPCPHECTYCYVPSLAEMYRKKWGPLRLNEGNFPRLGSGRTIFVGNMTDLFAESIPEEWIRRVLEHCAAFPGNEYLFQSKNPARLFRSGLADWKNATLATTVETDSPDYHHSVAPSPMERLKAFGGSVRGRKLVTVEPIMRFGPGFAGAIIAAKPDVAAIGAESKGNVLPEPSAEDIMKLAGSLNAAGIRVYMKCNIRRLVPGAEEGYL